MNRYIDSEIILTRKIKYIVYVYVMIIIIMLLSLIIAFMLLDYKTYYKLRGLVTKDDSFYYIKLYIPLDNIKFITNNNIIIIDNKKYYYQIREIDSEYFTDNITTYQIVTINLDMPNKYKYNNLTLDLKLIKENKKIASTVYPAYQFEGGADPILITGIVTMVIAFVSGILNGIANPKKCN